MTVMNFTAWFLFAAVACIGVLGQSDTDDRYQLEHQRPGEIEYTRAQDEQFDAMVGNDATRPDTNPTRNQVRREYRNQKERLLREAPRDQRDKLIEDQNSMTFDPTVQYISASDWLAFSNNQTCCGPPTYGCESRRVPMPCFLQRYSGSNRRQWCCPFHPELTIKKCTCNRCALLKSKCAKEGKCRRRYKPKNFYAICYRNSGWNVIKYVTMNLPTSCYCRTD